MKSVIPVKGMTCGGCKAGVERAVEYDEKKTALAGIRAAVAEAGFNPG